MKRIIALVMIVLLFAWSLTSMAAEGDIVDIASSDPSFSTLVAALAEAELVEALQAEGPFTVFAPTDEAFTMLLNDLGIDAAALLAHPDLSKVLLYHVVSGKVMSSDLSDGMMAETLNGESLTIGVGDGVTINESNVTTADLEGTNGVIHVIDKVLVPTDFVLDSGDMMSEDTMSEDTMSEDMMEKADIVGVALGDPQFSMLVSLLQKADLVGALQGEGPFTVFAPTNDAFAGLVAALGITPEELMAQPQLAEVLLYHVVSGKVMSTDLTDGLMAPTLNGETVTFDLSSGVKVNGASVIAADVEASNGVIHVIDGVLVPQSFVLQAVDMGVADVPKTGEPFVLPIIILGGASLVGAVLGKRKMNG